MNMALDFCYVTPSHASRNAHLPCTRRSSIFSKRPYRAPAREYDRHGFLKRHILEGHSRRILRTDFRRPNCLNIDDRSGSSELGRSCSGSMALSRFRLLFKGYAGKPGLVMFYNLPHEEDDGNTGVPSLVSNGNRGKWILGPTVLVASFVLPSLFARKIISCFFEDSLLSDFLILFFTEVVFYCGVAAFLLLTDKLQDSNTLANRKSPETSQNRSYRLFFVTTLVLSLMIPVVAMVVTWSWIGPASSVTLAPYLVGILIQFSFQQHHNKFNRPSLGAITSIVFQVYRLHQLNRAAQLVTALSFTVRTAEMTSQNMAISNSLGILSLAILLLGIICVWSLSSFLVCFRPSPVTL